jgi:hypothetical protein
MARHVVKRDGGMTATKALDAVVGEKILPGGASGQPESADPNPSSTHIHGIADVAPARFSEVRSEVPARRFQVTGGPSQVMYNGALTRMLHGKIYVETAVDIDYLRRQGVQFEELTAQAAVA